MPAADERLGAEGRGPLRIILVEDESMVSLALQDMLADLGCEIAGTAARLGPALDLARNLDFDVAVLDIDIGGARIDPVAEVIAARGLPVVFITGYDPAAAPRGVPGAVLQKPCVPADLERALRAASAGRCR